MPWFCALDKNAPCVPCYCDFRQEWPSGALGIVTLGQEMGLVVPLVL